VNPNAVVEVVYGGTFDPFHIGHQAACEYFLSHPLVDRLRLLPCYLPALKNKAQVSASHRVAMLQAWRNEHPKSQRILIDTREVERNRVSYTVDTWQSLLLDQPSVERVFGLGSDAFNHLDKWHKADWLMQHCRFWVLSRAEAEAVVKWPSLVQLRQLDKLFYSSQGCFFVDDAVNVALSSTQIRQQGVLQNQVPGSVFTYIKQHSLY